MKIDLLIIIPCYNEEKRLEKQAISLFLRKQKKVFLLFVNDHSSDSTLTILKDIHKENPKNTDIYSCKKNVGKAEAVRQGIIYSQRNLDFEKFAYIDADFSLSLDECLSISKKIKNEVSFCFASRILKIDNTVERNFYRFVIGRIVASFISSILKISVYDTQCGCKIFAKKNIDILFQEPFISKWLFDVEIFARFILHYGRDNIKKMVREIPVKEWINKGDSKVSSFYFFKLWYDLYKIKKTYSVRENSN